MRPAETQKQMFDPSSDQVADLCWNSPPEWLLDNTHKSMPNSVDEDYLAELVYCGSDLSEDSVYSFSNCSSGLAGSNTACSTSRIYNSNNAHTKDALLLQAASWIGTWMLAALFLCTATCMLIVPMMTAAVFVHVSLIAWPLVLGVVRCCCVGCSAVTSLGMKFVWWPCESIWRLMWTPRDELEWEVHVEPECCIVSYE